MCTGVDQGVISTAQHTTGSNKQQTSKPFLLASASRSVQPRLAILRPQSRDLSHLLLLWASALLLLLRLSRLEPKRRMLHRLAVTPHVLHESKASMLVTTHEMLDEHACSC